MILTLTMSPAVDMFAVTEQFFHDSKTRCQITRHLPGGGGINVARNLRRMGISTTAVFPAGGFHGELLSKLLEEDGQSCLRVSVTHETTQNIVLDEKATGLALHLVFPGARLEKDEWLACQKAIRDFSPQPQLLVISGSLPPSVPDSFFAELVEQCHERNLRVVLDTSGNPLRLALAKGVHLVKLNREDFSALGYDGGESPAERLPALKTMLAEGMADHMVLTLGPNGAMLASRDGLHLHARPPSVEVVSHAGAGDAFVSVMTCKLYQGQPVREAFAYGVAAAAAAISTPGNQLEDMDWLEQVREGTVITEL